VSSLIVSLDATALAILVDRAAFGAARKQLAR